MLWFVVNTDLTVTTEKLVELFAKSDEVYIIQKHLDIPESKVAEIGTDRFFRTRDAYLDLYATTHPCPSWRQVAELLHSVGLPRQAGVVENTYVQGTMIILIHSFCVHYYHRVC